MVRREGLSVDRPPYSSTHPHVDRSRTCRSKDHRKVPIATIDDANFLGSDEIVKGLLANQSVRERLRSRGATKDTFDSASAQRWVTFANDELAPLLYPNMCRTYGDAYQAFGYVDNVREFSFLQRHLIRLVGSFAMHMAASRVKSKYAFPSLWSVSGTIR